MYSPRFEAALNFAGLRHSGQVRKGTGAPYLVHLMHVSSIVARAGYDEDTQIVALLHDVLEDTTSGRAEIETVSRHIREQFGPAVGEAVETLTEPKRDADGERLPWRVRKERYLKQLKKGTSMALAVSAADKLHNLATLDEELTSEGETVWKRFRVGPDETFWFYGAVHGVLEERLGGPIVDALHQKLTTMRVSDP